MKNATMLYIFPGPHAIHGGMFDYVVVDEAEIEGRMADGWHLTTTDAKAAHDAAQAEAAAATLGDNAAPTREELKAKADELKLSYPANIPTAKLAELVEQALAAG